MEAGMQRRAVLRGGLALPWAAAAIAAPLRFPLRPITLICPWPAGGSSDAVLRAFADSAARVLGVAVVVENRPGVGGTLGATAMLRAAPDGYTLTQLPLGVFRLPHMQKMAFDPLKDLSPIIGLSGYTFGLAATLDAPYKTLPDMVAWARAHPGLLVYGHTGAGTTPHLAFEEFAHLAGFTTQDVPFKGSAEITQAILGGHLPLMSGTLEFAPHVRAGKLRLLATLGAQRSKAFPDTPTVKECGWDTVSESPFGIAGPKGMDAAVVRVLHDAFKQTLTDPKVLETLDRFQQPLIYLNTEDYKRYAVRTFEAERLTIARMGLAKKA